MYVIYYPWTKWFLKPSFALRLNENLSKRKKKEKEKVTHIIHMNTPERILPSWSSVPPAGWRREPVFNMITGGQWFADKEANDVSWPEKLLFKMSVWVHPSVFWAFDSNFLYSIICVHCIFLTSQLKNISFFFFWCF